VNADIAKKTHLEAQQLFQQKKFAEALTLLDKLAEAFPNEQNVMYARARCLVALGRWEDARPVCEFLKDVLGHARGAELLAHIDSKTTAAPSAFGLGSAASKPATISRQQRSGTNKWVMIGSALTAAAIAAGAFYIYSSGATDTQIAEAAPLPLPDNPTFYKDVAPILNENCVVCHRTGEPVPMALTSFEQARPWAKSIRAMVDAKKMPPWHADPAIGSWANDRRLSERDLTTIVRWVDQGTPQGNPEDAPVTPTFVEGWQIGEPDTIFKTSTQILPAELEDEYRYVLVPTGFEKDRWISAAEIRPGNINVVHHVIVFTADPGKGKNGLGGSLGGFAPGSPPLVMENGRGMKIEAGAVLVLQIHYHKEPGKVERDETTIGLKFANETVKKELRFGSIGTESFVIPPRAPYFPVEAKFAVEDDIHLEQLVPHMHLRGQDMKVWAKYPDGRKEDLLFVPKYDFNWQTFYELEKPVALPKGTELYAYAHFDNSPANPFNPDPTAEVKWGEPTTAEMMYTFFTYTVDKEKLKVKDPGGT